MQAFSGALKERQRQVDCSHDDGDAGALGWINPSSFWVCDQGCCLSFSVRPLLSQARLVTRDTLAAVDPVSYIAIDSFDARDQQDMKQAWSKAGRA